jgi:hypothetical protein
VKLTIVLEVSEDNNTRGRAAGQWLADVVDRIAGKIRSTEPTIRQNVYDEDGQLVGTWWLER